MNQITRIQVPMVPHPADTNIYQQYEIQKAAWIWHPEKHADDRAVLIFKNEFSIKKTVELILHVSGDQRYELSLDHELVSCGPDRSDMYHWSFASYKTRLAPGKHVLTALAWWIGDIAPMAQESYRGGFILAAEGELSKVLNTGLGNWKVAEQKGWIFGEKMRDVYHDIGPSFIAEGKVLFGQKYNFVKPAIVIKPIHTGLTGVASPGWHLKPSPLPEQLCREIVPGKIRAVAARKKVTDIKKADIESKAIPAWQKLLDGNGKITVPANTSLAVLWDLENYYCGYPQLVVTQGKGSDIKVQWAEALFEKTKDGSRSASKGQRDQINNKIFYGFGDTFICDSGKKRPFRSLWWRSGRFILISITTKKQPLTIEKVSIRETRYPLNIESNFTCNDPAVNAIMPIGVRVLEMCSHETFMDCPYYEQMMYVGDTRLEMLVTYMLSRDERLIRRGMELFDWSRWKTGFIGERYPNRLYQLSLTFSMIWVLMLRDYAFWRNDPAWVKERMTGLRCLLEHFRTLLNDDGLLEGLPGWSFMDWVPEWDLGYAPDGRHGVSALNNLLFIYALRKATELEEVFGEMELAQRNRTLAESMAAQVRRYFWVPGKDLMADDLKTKHFSEHAQVLALLSDTILPEDRENCFQSLLTESNLKRTTIYFSFYLLETFYMFNRGDLIIKKLDFWKNLVKQGFKTTVEAPEPSRSDCHAWGAHPLFHFHASLIGIRPSGPGFLSVIIAPSPGNLTHLTGKLPHPEGFIETDLYFDKNRGTCTATIRLPENVKGIFRWQGKSYELKVGQENAVVAG